MDHIPVHNLDKDQLLNNSKCFCMIPWVHLHRLPDGDILPCCTGSMDYKKEIPSNGSVEDAINSDFMKQLRLNMLADKPSGVCKQCYQAENTGGQTLRQQSLREYGKYLDQELLNTSASGHLYDFKMRYFDFRFSNICNFKCRSCNSGYSSLWEAEDIKYGYNHRGGRVSKKTPAGVIDEILGHIPHMERAYFAGGEPLITDEHYMMLTRMLEAGRTDIKLIYNSNASTLNFKGYDLMELWSQFDHPVEFCASIDHFGHRAEYIRHGTKWAETEEVLKTIKQSDFVDYGITTAVTNMNYPGMHEFVEYMLEKDLWPDLDWQLNPVWNPSYMCAQALPESIKQQATEKLVVLLNSLIQKIKTGKLDVDLDGVKRMKNIATMVHDQHTWQHNFREFKNEMFRLDKIRNESFCKTFPDLAEMVL